MVSDLHSQSQHFYKDNKKV